MNAPANVTITVRRNIFRMLLVNKSWHMAFLKFIVFEKQRSPPAYDWYFSAVLLCLLCQSVIASSTKKRLQREVKSVCDTVHDLFSRR